MTNRIMALSAKLQMRQSQSLVMTPQLAQSIRLLQMTHVELSRFIEEEIERNPLLARDGSGAAISEGTLEGARPGPRADSERMAERLDTSLENLFPDDPGRVDRLAPDLGAQWKSAPAGTSGPRGADGFDLESIAAAPTTLRGHVEDQIAFHFRNGPDLLIARELADCLDDAGYLAGGIEEIAARLGVATERVELVLARCQALDPAGIFARDLAECLAIQLRRRDRFDPAMAALVAHLELLARRDFAALSRLCGVDAADLADMLDEIRALDPKPGTAFSVAPAAAIIPDVEVTPAPDGGWRVELNAAALPKVLVDRAYCDRVLGATRERRDREFLADCLQNASWLARSLDQRARTILKVAGEIVRRQDGFLLHGIAHLRPLNLRTVAEAIGMHESTVSRVTANKFMATPRGTFELRFFFNASIAATGDGEAHAAQSVQHRVRELIDREPPDAVLSDDAIVDILRKSGIDIARRTVAKYREAMNIPSSVRRRREKRARAAAGR
jgi:RNA polymerase sigma-54 factor